MRPLSPPLLPMTPVVAFYAVLALVAVAVSVGHAGRLPWRVTDAVQPVWVQLGVGLGGGLALVAVSRWLDAHFAWSRRLTAGFAERIGPSSPARALAFGCSSGVGEELLFRGLLLPLVGWTASSVIFGILHFVPQRSWLPWTVVAVVGGFYFGALAVLTGTVLAPIVAHTVVNTLNLLALEPVREAA